MRKQVVTPFVASVRKKYFDEIGIGHLSESEIQAWSRKRMRSCVEERNALLNALSPFVGRVDSACVFYQDHTTVLHAVKNHEMYMRYSGHYCSCYEKATRIVSDIARDMKVYPIGHHRVYINTEMELEVLQKTLDNLQNIVNDVRERIKKNQNPVRGYSSVPDRQEQ